MHYIYSIYQLSSWSNILKLFQPLLQGMVSNAIDDILALIIIDNIVSNHSAQRDIVKLEDCRAFSFNTPVYKSSILCLSTYLWLCSPRLLFHWVHNTLTGKHHPHLFESPFSNSFSAFIFSQTCFKAEKPSIVSER